MEDLIQHLKSKQIPVFVPGDDEYERSVANPNLIYRFARPPCVIEPENPSHVQTIVREAKARGLHMTIKNGGHSHAGFSTAHQDISLDLYRMNNVKLNMDDKTITLGAGAKWGHAYKALVNERCDEYIVNGGRCPTVGVSGFNLGGGLGPFSRSFGLGCDTLEEMIIVTADGNLVTVRKDHDKDSDEGRLFWALCGAGGGNFGVVVQMTMKLQKLETKGGFMVAGKYTWAPTPDDESMEEFLKTMNRFLSTDWPKEATIDAYWLCDLQQSKNILNVNFPIYYAGTKKQFNDMIDENVSHETLNKQLKRRSVYERSSRFFQESLVYQWSDEKKRSLPTSRTYDLHTSFVFENDPERISRITKIIVEEMLAFRREFAGESALMRLTWIHSGGKASERDPSATAFPWRSGVYYTYIWLQWDEKFLEKDMRGFMKKCKLRLKPETVEGYAAYVNFPDGTLKSNASEKVYYGENRQKLREIKKKWDEDNYFRWYQGIHPSPEGLRTDTEGATISSDGESTDTEDLTDLIASEQWETYNPPEPNNYVGGIHGLNDLGF